MEKAQIDKIMVLLKDSPIRRAYKSSNKELLKEEGIVLENVEDLLGTLKVDGPKAVNVVVMGEVKSGKSTFVNALMGKEVSKVDVLEATSAIYEMIYDEDICYDIHYTDGRVQSVFDEREALKLMESGSNPGKTQQEIRKVQVRLPLEILKKVQIVDTPGLHTVTAANIKVTEEYMVHADAILWILNIHHMGQRDVIDEIMKCRSFGKPIIALVNRVDEIEEDLDEVMSYVEEEMGYLFTKIIPISARTSWRGVMENNQQKMKDGKVPDVLLFLQERIADRSTQFIGETTIQTIRTQLAREIEVHQNTATKMKQALEKMDRQLKGVEENNNRIKNVMRNRADGIFNDTKVIYDYVNNPDSFILQHHIENSYRKISERITEEWVQYCELMIESDEKLEANRSQYSGDAMIDDMYPQIERQAKKRGNNNDDVVKMSLATLVSTAALATFFAPPILIGGVFLGGVYLTKSLSNNRSQDEDSYHSEAEIYHKARRMMDSARQSQLYNITQQLDSFSDMYCNKVREIITTYYFGEELKINTITKLNSDILEYVSKVTAINH